MSSILKIESLTFGYEKEKDVLNNVSFEIKKGTITAILGKNGCGKSTLLDCIMGLNEYKNGNVFIYQKNINLYSEKEMAKTIAYISQSTTINIDYTVKEFLLFGRTPHLNPLQQIKEEDYEKVSQIASKCGIEYLLDKEINKISGGERQLCFICRALIQEADLLLFDEPTASLDFGNQYKLFLLMKDLQKEGKTIIFTTHNPNQVVELDTNVLVLNDGDLLYQGNAKEVVTKDLLQSIYGVEFSQVGSGTFQYFTT